MVCFVASRHWILVSWPIFKWCFLILNNYIQRVKTLYIAISENDFPSFESSTDAIPATFSAMIELLKNGTQDQIVLETSGGMSATKLLGRFCNVN